MIGDISVEEFPPQPAGLPVAAVGGCPGLAGEVHGGQTGQAATDRVRLGDVCWSHLEYLPRMASSRSVRFPRSRIFSRFIRISWPRISLITRLYNTSSLKRGQSREAWLSSVSISRPTKYWSVRRCFLNSAL